MSEDFSVRRVFGRRIREAWLVSRGGKLIRGVLLGRFFGSSWSFSVIRSSRREVVRYLFISIGYFLGVEFVF